MARAAGNTTIDRTLELPGRGRVVVRDIPGPANGPTLLLLHGLGATGRLNWGRCFRPLSECFRVLSVDHRGHGQGLRTNSFTLEECADDAVAAADALGVRRFIPVGYSMGGPIASLAWHRHPERVAGLVLCATARHFAAPIPSRFMGMALPVAAAAARLVPGLVQRQMIQRLLAGVDDPAMRRRIREELEGHEPATVIQAAAAISGFSSRDWIGKVDVPTAVVVTTRDELVPPSRQRKLAASIPGAVVFEVDAGHDACVRAGAFTPALLNACLSVSERASRAEPTTVGAP